MRKPFLFACMVFGTLLTATPLFAQDEEEEAPPVFTDVTMQILRNVGGDRVEGPFTGPFDFDPETDLARELDIILIDFEITDVNFPDDELFFQQLSVWIPVPGYEVPEGPPVRSDDPMFVPVPGPGAGDVAMLERAIQIPEINGRNQARLRGLIDYDVRYAISFSLSNTEDPDPEEDPIPTIVFIVDVVSNPAADPGNPPVFADAGPDQEVESGSTVQLDASGTFDSFNLGFDPLDPDVFERDIIDYSWEWISGPERVDPIYRNPDEEPWLAEVTLNAVGTYRYRLTADDGSDNDPTSDTVTIEVLSDIPDNTRPRARVRAPSDSVVVGSLVRLDGTGSSDPEGDALNYRWRQTDEVGGVLSPADAREAFQPLSGLESPVTTWQALKPGTFYFLLIVDDGSLSDSERISITVVDSETAGVMAERNAAGDSDTGDPPADGLLTPGSACGGVTAPLAVIPFALFAARLGRRRR